ncbi:hypothetical protein F3157_05350 [Virgibacillus dakarensis]|nr:hypothetical protein [Virgibacillus dakarensis]
MAEKMNISYRIRAIDNFTKTHKKLERQLQNINRIAKRVSVDQDLHIDAHTKEAERKLDATNRKAKAIPNYVPVKVQTFGGGGFDKLARKLETVNTISRSMIQGGIWTALPMLSPILASTAGGAGALASALTSAGIGSAGFAAVAVPALTGVFKAQEKVKKAQEAIANAETPEELTKATAELNKVYAGLSDTQKDTLKSMKKFSDFYKEFAKEFEKPVLQIFNKSMQTAQTLLTKLKPAIQGVADTGNRLMDALNRNLEAADMRAFFDWVNATAAPYLDKLVRGVGNFAAGFANMMVAFDPLAKSFMDGFLNMSERFREWAATLEDNKAFQNFLNYVKENGPKVMELIGNLTQFLVQLGIAMAPVAEKILDLTNKFLVWSTELLKNNDLIAKLVGILPVAIGIFKLLAPPITLAIGVFTKLWPLIKKVGTTIGKVLPWVTKIGGKMKWLAGGPMGLVIGIVAELAAVIFKNWDEIWGKTKEIFSNIGDFISDKWGAIKDWTSDAVSKVKSWTSEKFNAAKDAISSAMGKAKDAVGDKWETIKSKFSSGLDKVKSWTSEKFGDLPGTVREKMGDVKDKVKEGWGRVTDFLSGINLRDMGKNVIQGFINGVGDKASSLVDKVKGVVGDAIQGAKNLLGIHSPSKVFAQIGRYTGEGFIVGMDRMTSKVTQASNRMTGAAIPKAYNGKAVYPIRRGYSKSEPAQAGSTAGTNFYHNPTFNFTERDYSPSEIARKEKQAMRNWAMGANF